MAPQAVLELENLAKTYGDVEAVGGVSFSIVTGEIVGLLGPNGAGKTTTINMILGLIEPTSGRIHIFGKDLSTHRAELLAKVNFAAVYAQLPSNLTIWQNLRFFSLLYDIPNARARAEEMIELFDLAKFKHTKSGVLSSGELSRLNLAKALLNEPKLLMLDEPTASLDPSASDVIRRRITSYAKDKGVAVLWTSHDMNEIERVCDRVLFISHGKILLEGNPRTLAAERGKKNLEELFIAIAREPLTTREP